MKARHTANKKGNGQAREVNQVADRDREIAAMWNKTRAQVTKLSSQYEKVRRAELTCLVPVGQNSR